MDRPNILLLISDHHRGDWMPYGQKTHGVLQNPPIPLKMPVIEELMMRGTSFYHALSPSPLCAPARACLASGMRYEHCGVIDNGQDYPVDKPTFYSVLKQYGYHVGTVGKLDLTKPTPYWGLDGWVEALGTMGFTHAINNEGKWDGYNTGQKVPQGPYFNYLHKTGLIDIHVADFAKRKKNKNDTSVTMLPEEAYCDNWLTDNGLQFLSLFQDDAPFFLQVNFTGPHPPWDITAGMKRDWEHVSFQPPVAGSGEHPDIDNSIRQNFAAMIENIDRNAGRLLSMLQEQGRLENTIVVYTADHGEMLGDFDTYGKCVPRRGSVSIPMVIAGPGISRRECSKEIMELQDLSATLLDLCGISIPDHYEALSYKEYLSEQASHGPRSWGYSAFRNWKMVLEGGYKAWFYDSGECHLFNIEQDPWERFDLAQECPDIVAQLKRRFVPGTKLTAS